VRRPDGDLHVELHPIAERWQAWRRTFLRGPLALVESLQIGMRAVRIALGISSGQQVPVEAMRMVFVPVAIGIVGVFVALPGIATSVYDGIVADVVEAVARAAMLVTYLVAVSHAEQSKRLFGYHGAEHMAIAAFERAGRMPTPAEAGAESPIHVRCGTDFVALFVIVCGVVFSFVGRRPVWLGGTVRVVLVPVCAALAYETMRACARRPHSMLARSLTWPGRALQRITTRPPDPGQLEVALAALGAAAGRGTTSAGPTDP
jgi:uncharacterized protein YqhQ